MRACSRQLYALPVLLFAQDEKRIAAQKISDEAKQLREQGSPESLRQAIVKYGEALLLWRELNNRQEEAATLASLGATYYLLDEQQKAREFYEQALPILCNFGKHRNRFAPPAHVMRHWSNHSRLRSPKFSSRSWMLIPPCWSLLWAMNAVTYGL